MAKEEGGGDGAGEGGHTLLMNKSKRSMIPFFPRSYLHCLSLYGLDHRNVISLLGLTMLICYGADQCNIVGGVIFVVM